MLSMDGCKSSDPDLAGHRLGCPRRGRWRNRYRVQALRPRPQDRRRRVRRPRSQRSHLLRFASQDRQHRRRAWSGRRQGRGVRRLPPNWPDTQPPSRHEGQQCSGSARLTADAQPTVAALLRSLSHPAHSGANDRYQGDVELAPSKTGRSVRARGSGCRQHWPHDLACEHQKPVADATFLPTLGPGLCGRWHAGRLTPNACRQCLPMKARVGEPLQMTNLTAAGGMSVVVPDRAVKGASSTPCSRRRPTRATGSCRTPTACVRPCGRAAR